MKFGLMFFASSEEALAGNKYRVVLDSARFADANGFSSVWVPERHFTEFGSLYPNPAVLHAALAVSTSRVRLHAGSVVAPLHHPIRIAEEWSMVDNLSNGRVGISFASGWNPDDFAFCPDQYASRQEDMLDKLRTVQHLWRGGNMDARSGNGKPMQLRIYPTPVQPELPVWLTAAGNPQTFIRAGEIGANLLTHVLDQDQDQLAQKIALYREARAKAGLDPQTGTVTVMLHTFVGSDGELVREQARTPFCNYIRSNIGLLNGLAQSRGQHIDVRAMPERELSEFVEFLYERFAQSRGLIGTPESCLGLVQSLAAIGVDEIACLLDFGPSAELILENLPHLLRLRQLGQTRPSVAETAFDPALVQARCVEQLSGAQFNDSMREHGIHIEGEFLAIGRIWRRAGEALGDIQWQADAASSASYAVHPAFLDACSRVLAAAIEQHGADTDGFYLPSSVGSVRMHRQPAELYAWSHAILGASSAADAFEGNVRVYDRAGRLLIEIEALRLQRVDASQPAQRRDVAPLLYRRDWKPLEPQADIKTSTAGTWLIYADRRGVGAQVAAQLEQEGNTCVLQFPDSPATELSMLERPLKGIIHLWSLELTPADSEGRKRLNGSVLQIVKTQSSGPASGPKPRLWLATCGAMPVLEDESPAVAQTPLWGLGRAIAVEHADIWGGLIDLDPEVLSKPALLETIQRAGREDMLAIRRGKTYVARIVHDDRKLPESRPPRFKQAATYLVTGGLGGLGLRVAAWLRAHGAGRIAVLGRGTPNPAAEAALKALDARFIRCDLSRREEVADAIGEIERVMPPLKGIFHLAGSLDDALLNDQDAEHFAGAGAGKANGAWYLHELTDALPLEHFVCFSSMASLMTMPGQGNYAAANSFLDALAHLRRAAGKPALSINWGPWAEIGHAATDYGRLAHERLASMGIAPLPPELAIETLERLLAAGVTQAGVANVDWPRLFQADPPAAASTLLSDVLQRRTEPLQQETPLLIELKSRAPLDRPDLVIAVLAGMLAEALRLPDPESISPTRSFFELGLDSIIALELTNRLAALFGRPFRGTLFFSYTNLDALAGHILDELSSSLGSHPLDEDEEFSDEELSELVAQEISRA